MSRMTNELAIRILTGDVLGTSEQTHEAVKMAIKALSNTNGETIYRQAAIDALWKSLYEYENKTEKQFQESEDLDVGDWIEHRIFVQNMNDIDRQTILDLPSAQPEITKEYNLKKIYNIYVKIAQAHFVYQPSKPKAITAMPFDWLEVQNLLEKYLEDHGADFDALCREYVCENVKDDHLPPAHPETEERTEESAQNVPNGELISKKTPIGRGEQDE